MNDGNGDGREGPALAAARDRLEKVLGPPAGRWVAVSVELQRLLLVEGDAVIGRYGISTAAAGVNGREGSYGTPPGVHRVERKIGAGQAVGTWFRSRVAMGSLWTPDSPGADEGDLILSRIMTLAGCEEGVNSGPGCDSAERFIYLHGTNHEAEIGRPSSHGCIRMSNADVVDLFERIEEGAPVVIV